MFTAQLQLLLFSTPSHDWLVVLDQKESGALTNQISVTLQPNTQLMNQHNVHILLD